MRRRSLSPRAGILIVAAAAILGAAVVTGWIMLRSDAEPEHGGAVAIPAPSSPPPDMEVASAAGTDAAEAKSMVAEVVDMSAAPPRIAETKAGPAKVVHPQAATDARVKDADAIRRPPAGRIPRSAEEKPKAPAKRRNPAPVSGNKRVGDDVLNPKW